MTTEEIAQYKQKLRDAIATRKLEAQRVRYVRQQIEDTRSVLARLEVSLKKADSRAEQASIAEVNLRKEIRVKIHG